MTESIRSRASFFILAAACVAVLIAAPQAQTSMIASSEHVVTVPTPRTYYVTGWRASGRLPSGEEYVTAHGLDELDAVTRIGLTVWTADKWSDVLAQASKNPGQRDIRELVIPNDAPAQMVCFGSDDATAGKQVGDTMFVGKDCLPIAELRALVSGRKSATASLAAYTLAQQTADAFKTAYAKAENDLGDCQASLAPWTKIGGAIAAGTSMVVDLPTLKARIESANPGKTIGADWKIVDKPGGLER